MIQLQFLNYILKSGDSSLISLNNLNEDYFSDYREEFKFIDNHIRTYNKVPDIETFLGRFKNFDVVEVRESESYLISALVDDFNTRKLANVFKKISPLVQAGRVEEAIRIYKDVAENLNKGVSLKSIDILRDTHRFEEYLEKTKNPSTFFFSTSFVELDEILNGFDRKEEIVVVSARPGVGKSLIALKFAIQAAKEGLRVGLYSGEMSASKVGARADTLIEHISNGAIIHGNEIIKEQYKAFMESLPGKFPGCIKVITPETVDGPVTTNVLKIFVEKEKLDLLIVDQISLVDEPRGKSAKEKTSLIMKDLKKLQATKQMPIIIVAQQNRETNDDGSFDTTQLADADEVGRYATVVIFLEKDKKDPNIFKLHLAKVRDGTSGQTLSYQVNINKGEFVYIPEGDKPISQQEVASYSSPENNEDYFG